MKITDKFQWLKKPFYLVERLTNRVDSKTKALRFLWESFPWLMVVIIVLFIMIMGGLIKGEKESLEKAKKAAIKKDIPPVSVITLNLVSSRLEDKINLPAQVEPYEDIQVKAEVPGQVVKVLVGEGQEVEKGQVLIQLDDRDYRSRLERIKANYRLAKLDYDRTMVLANKKVTSLSNLDTIEAQLKDIEAQLKEAELALSRTRITSPICCLCNEINAKKGDFVSVGDPVVRIIQIDPIKVVVGVPESDVAAVFDLTQAEVIIEALEKYRVKGKKVFLSRQPRTLARLFDLELRVPNPEGRILPGMFARVELVKEVFNQALAVPLYAVISQSDEHIVYIEKEGRAESRNVELGPLVGWQVQVTSGLSPGEKVIVVGHRLLDNGQEVEVIKNVNHPSEILKP
jgi:RND family efflux transporter MFP subunit